MEQEIQKIERRIKDEILDHVEELVEALFDDTFSVEKGDAYESMIDCPQLSLSQIIENAIYRRDKDAKELLHIRSRYEVEKENKELNKANRELQKTLKLGKTLEILEKHGIKEA